MRDSKSNKEKKQKQWRESEGQSMQILLICCLALLLPCGKKRAMDCLSISSRGDIQRNTRTCWLQTLCIRHKLTVFGLTNFSFRLIDNFLMKANGFSLRMLCSALQLRATSGLPKSLNRLQNPMLPNDRFLNSRDVAICDFHSKTPTNIHRLR